MKMRFKELKPEEIMYYKEVCKMDMDDIEMHQIQMVNETIYYLVNNVKWKLKLSQEGVISAFNMGDEEIFLFIKGTDFTKSIALLDEELYEKLLKHTFKLMQMTHEEAVELMVEQFGIPKETIKEVYFELN